jgi:hypothetical protein
MLDATEWVNFIITTIKFITLDVLMLNTVMLNIVAPLASTSHLMELESTTSFLHNCVEVIEV